MRTIFLLSFLGLCQCLSQFNLENRKDRGFDVYECRASDSEIYTLSNNIVSMERLIVVGNAAGVDVRGASELTRTEFKDVELTCDSIRNSRELVISVGERSYTCQVNIIT